MGPDQELHREILCVLQKPIVQSAELSCQLNAGSKQQHGRESHLAIGIGKAEVPVSPLCTWNRDVLQPLGQLQKKTTSIPFGVEIRDVQHPEYTSPRFQKTIASIYQQRADMKSCSSWGGCALIMKKGGSQWKPPFVEFVLNVLISK